MQHSDEGTIHAWLDGALGAVQARDAELHVATCRECAERVAEARGLIAASSRILTALDHVPADVVPAPARHVAMAAAAAPMPMVAAAAPPAATPPARRSWWGHRYARVAAVIALVAAGTLVVARESERDAAAGPGAAHPVSQRARVADSMAVAAAPPAPAALGGAPRRGTGAPQSAGKAGAAALGAERAKADAMSSALQASRANTPRALEMKGSAESNQVIASPEPHLVATDTVRRGAIVVRRETYQVGDQHVVLESQPSAAAPNDQARANAAPAAPAAADSAATVTDTSPVVIRVIRWRGTDGVDYTLSGPLSADALERVRVALGKG